MQLLIATWDGYSHVTTAMSLVRRLVLRGHTVRWLCERRYCTFVERAGATLVPTAYTPSHLDAPARPLRDWIALFQQEAMAQAADLIAAVEETLPDVLLVDPTVTGVSAMAPGYPDVLVGMLGCVPLLHVPREVSFVLQGCLPQLELPVPVQWQSRICFTGPLLPWPMDELTPAEQQRYADVIPTDRPIIVVTQGTVATDPADLVQPTIDALADLPVFVLAQGDCTGHVRPAKNVLELPWIPFGRVLPRTACLVSNGGYQGVQWCTAAGVPMVVDGKTEDKPEVGLRVEWAGLGINLSQAPTTPARLRDAVQQVLLNPRYREQAQRLAAHAALQDSATIGAQVIELERARSVPAVEDDQHAAA